MYQVAKLSWIAAFALSLAACGGGGGGTSTGSSSGGGSSSSQATQQSAEGLWTGTAVNSATHVSIATYGIITSAGQMLLAFSYNGAYYAMGTGTVNVNAATVSSPDYVVLGLGTGAGTTGTLDGGVSSKLSLIAKSTYPDNADDTLNLSYDKQYEESASLATVKGNYAILNALGVSTGSFAVDDAGSIAGTNNGCPISGKLAIHGSGSRNVYDVTISASGGTACATQLTNLSGLATYAKIKSTDSAKSLLIGATRKDGTQYSVFIAAGLRS
ncbi:MAG: hypothetical protein QM639_03615 [Rhodocyclaceae bacterium]